MYKYLLTSLPFLIATFLHGQEIEMFQKKADNGAIEVWVRNRSTVTHTVKLDIDQKGMIESERSPIIKVMKGQQESKFVTLTPKPQTSYQFGQKIVTVRGNALAEHDDSYVYTLPFPKGKSYRVDQGYYGKQTHTNRASLDFGMEEGSEIAAIRDGTVVEVVEHNNKGCPRQECASLSNFILVEHSDGSLANYAHLQKKGALVKQGDTVSAGDIIGLSGSTGWASGPHLHLEVYTTSWNDQETIPVKYQLSNEVGIPKEGNTYTH